MEDSDDGSSLLFKSRVELCKAPAGANMARELIGTFKRNSTRELLVDAASGQRWTGGQLLDRCGRIATSLVRQANVQVDDVVMTICDRTDSELITALGIVLSGAALYPTTPVDGYNEAHQLCELVRPQVLAINSVYHERALKLRQCVAGMSEARIVWIDGVSTINGATQPQPMNGFRSNGFGEKTLLDENNNTNNHHSQLESIVERDRVITLANIDQQPLDMKLVEQIASQMIKPDEHICNYLLTSGSTGKPKVVPVSHKATIYTVYCPMSAATNPLNCGKLNVDENNNQDSSEQTYLLPLTCNDVVAGDLPLDHGAGLTVMFLSMRMGAKYVVMPSFNVDAYWNAVSKFKITFSISSTSFFFQLFNHLKRMINENESSENLPDLSSLKYVSCCGAKLTYLDLVREIQAHYPHLSVNQGYGCTEIGYISGLPKHEARDYPDSVGYLFPGITAKVVDPNNLNKTLGPGQRGELLLWSRSLFQRYRCCPGVDAEQINKNCRDDKGIFYRTGDQVHFDHDGRLYVHGRFKDTLVLQGEWKIMPAELEEVINEHPLVETSAVVGVPNLELACCDKPKAFVKLIELDNARKSSQIDSDLLARLQTGDLASIAADISKFVADRTAPAKHLTGGVRIVEEFPRNGLLRKIDRKVLKEMD